MENLDVLTDQKIKGERLSNFVIERNWELIENLRTSMRINYGMKKSNQESSEKRQNNQEDDDDNAEPKAKHVRFNND